MKTIQVGKFKTYCLSLLKEVMQKHETIVITKYGKPIARVIPFSNTSSGSPIENNPLKNSIVFEEDLIEPIVVKWNASL